MANIVIIQKLNSEVTKTKTGSAISTTKQKDGEYVYPLLEDVTFDYSSEIGSMLDNIPGFSTITNIMSMMNSFAATGGSATEGNLSMEQLMEGPRWKKTNPVKFPIKILLYTKTDVYEDVWLPAKEFISMSILTKIKDGKKGYYITPGLNLNDLDAANKSKDKGPGGLKGNYISVEIPGMVYLPMAFIEKVTPAFSKEVCVSNSNNPPSIRGKKFPIWCELELNITGVYPATSEFLDMVADDTERPEGLRPTVTSGKAISSTASSASIGKK